MKNLLNVDRVKNIITYYGYTDGSGEYYLVIDAEKCDGCGDCVQICPQGALKMEEMFIDLEDKMVAVVTEEHRKKIRYTCSPCKPDLHEVPCVKICKKRAINSIWKPK
jgi:NAD-dependent dihydropyrimidine dehydrogenase PreA subunit